jgi:hypothetical protein
MQLRAMAIARCVLPVPVPPCELVKPRLAFAQRLLGLYLLGDVGVGAEPMGQMDLRRSNERTGGTRVRRDGYA